MCQCIWKILPSLLPFSFPSFFFLSFLPSFLPYSLWGNSFPKAPSDPAGSVSSPRAFNVHYLFPSFLLFLGFATMTLASFLRTFLTQHGPLPWVAFHLSTSYPTLSLYQTAPSHPSHLDFVIFPHKNGSPPFLPHEYYSILTQTNKQTHKKLPSI